MDAGAEAARVAISKRGASEAGIMSEINAGMERATMSQEREAGYELFVRL